MSYPLSSPVLEGQATEAAQYNNLRTDALFLGGDAAASGSLRDLLFSSAGVYSLVQEGKTTIKLPASSSAPVGLMIGGGIYSVSADVSLTVSSASTSSAGRYTIYAVGSDGTFSLALSATGQSRAIGTFCWDGSGIIPGTLHTSAALELMAAKRPDDASGRLSLVAGDPVPDSDIDLGTALYFVPYNGAEIALYLYGAWEYFTWSLLTLPSSGLTNETPYDVFLSADNNGLSLVGVPWVSNTRSSGALSWQDGIRVSGSDSSKRFLGSFALNSSGKFEDSRVGRLLWNENNRLARPVLEKLVTTRGQGTAHMGSWAPYFDDDAPSVRLLVSGSDVDFELNGVGISSIITETDAGYNRAACIGICMDMVKEAPYTANENLVPVFTHTCGKGPVMVSMDNFNTSLTGYHEYTLSFWSNYSYYPMGKALSAGCGEVPGLYGKIYA